MDKVMRNSLLSAEGWMGVLQFCRMPMVQRRMRTASARSSTCEVP